MYIVQLNLYIFLVCCLQSNPGQVLVKYRPYNQSFQFIKLNLVVGLCMTIYGWISCKFQRLTPFPVGDLKDSGDSLSPYKAPHHTTWPDLTLGYIDML